MQHDIRAVALDVDGVLTDGSFTWDLEGRESKRFHFRDIMGISRATRRGIRFALVSGERNAIVDRLAEKLGVADCHQGCTDKASALIAFGAKHGIALAEIAFMGDDINDLEALRLVGLPAVPADAHDRVREIAQFVSSRCGGHGAVRDLLDHLGLVA